MTILPCILIVVVAHIVFTGARVTSSLYALAKRRLDLSPLGY